MVGLKDARVGVDNQLKPLKIACADWNAVERRLSNSLYPAVVNLGKAYRDPESRYRVAMVCRHCHLEETSRR